DDSGDETPAIWVCNGRKHAAQVGRVRNVPEQPPAGGRVEEGAQCDVEPRERRGEISDGVIREPRTAVVAVHPLEEPHEVRAVRSFDGRPIRTATLAGQR